MGEHIGHEKETGLRRAHVMARPVTAQPGIILALAFCDALMLMSNSPRLSNILIVAVVFVHMIAMTGLRRPPL